MELKVEPAFGIVCPARKVSPGGMQAEGGDCPPVNVEVRPTALAVVVAHNVPVQAHTRPVLPDVAALALEHQAGRRVFAVAPTHAPGHRPVLAIIVFILFTIFVESGRSRGFATVAARMVLQWTVVVFVWA